jgi:hypothetical protein
METSTHIINVHLKVIHVHPKLYCYFESLNGFDVDDYGKD